MRSCLNCKPPVTGRGRILWEKISQQRLSRKRPANPSEMSNWGVFESRIGASRSGGDTAAIVLSEGVRARARSVPRPGPGDTAAMDFERRSSRSVPIRAGSLLARRMEVLPQGRIGCIHPWKRCIEHY